MKKKVKIKKSSENCKKREKNPSRLEKLSKFRRITNKHVARNRFSTGT